MGSLFGCSVSAPPTSQAQPEGPPMAQAVVPTDDSVRSDVPARHLARHPEKPLAQTTPASAGSDSKNEKPKRKKARNADQQDIKRNYSELIKKPDQVGFEPSDNLYRNIYYNVKQWFVEDVADERMSQSLKKELANYFQQAKIPTDNLKQLDNVRPIEAFNKVMSLYGDKTNKSLLGYVTILGLLDGLHDPYSVLMTPAEYSKLEEQLQSREFGGIGIYIELDKDNNNQLTVFEPIEGTPAYVSGLEAGDKILKIDGKPTQGITLDVAQSQIRGPIGSTVRLTVDRKGQVKEFDVKRGSIHVVSVSSKMLPGNIGYVRLRAFGQDTGSELEKSIARLQEQGAKGLILDLRNNGGGYIDASVQVVSQFAPDKTLVVYTVDRGGKRKEYRSVGNGQVRVPVVCMINEFSASASEITAGALRDHKLATLVGDHSFGKGSVQQLFRPEVTNSAGPRLKLTVARFYTPNGTVIDKQGIEPNVAIDMEPRFVGRGETDTQLKKAVEVLKGNIQ